MNISREEYEYLLASNWSVKVMSTQFPNGEISGRLSLSTIYKAFPKLDALAPISWKTWVTLAILFLMFVFLIFDFVQPHFTLFATVVLLNVLGIITLEHIQEGYSAEALMTVIILMICVEPLQKTTLLRILSRYMFGGGSWTRLNLLRMMILMTFLSTWLANAPMTALFTPTVLEWCRMVSLPQSKFLMPMLYAIIMGGMNSLIGSSTNILVDGLLRSNGIESFGFFEPFYVVGICTFFSYLFMLTIGWWMLPTNESIDVEKSKGRRFLTKLKVDANSRICNYTFDQIQKKWNLYRLRLVEIEKGTIVDPPSKPVEEEPRPDLVTVEVPKIETSKEDQILHQVIQENDVLVLYGDVNVITKIMKIGGALAGNTIASLSNIIEDTPNPDSTKSNELIKQPEEKPKNPTIESLKKVFSYFFSEKKPKKKPLDYYQVVLSSTCQTTGKSFLDPKFLENYQAIILGSSKQSTQEEEFKYDELSYEAGDVLLITAKDDFYRKWIHKKDFLYIDKYEYKDDDAIPERLLTFRGKTYAVWWWDYLSYPIFLAMIVGATLSNNLGLGFPMMRCGLICLVLFIGLQIMTFEEAVKAISLKLIILIASSLTIGHAILSSGLATAFGLAILQSQIPPVMIPSILFLFAMIITQFVHNNATAAIFFPLALGVSQTLNINMKPLAIAIVIASNCSFATPIGYECNMMIQGAGQYHFKDYVIYGTPVCLIFFTVCSIFVPLMWPL